jgi:hypothetical protein
MEMEKLVFTFVCWDGGYDVSLVKIGTEMLGRQGMGSSTRVSLVVSSLAVIAVSRDAAEANFPKHCWMDE